MARAIFKNSGMVLNLSVEKSTVTFKFDYQVREQLDLINVFANVIRHQNQCLVFLSSPFNLSTVHNLLGFKLRICIGSLRGMSVYHTMREGKVCFQFPFLLFPTFINY